MSWHWQRYIVQIETADGPGFSYSTNATSAAQARVLALEAWRQAVGALNPGRRPSRIMVRDMCAEIFRRHAMLALEGYAFNHHHHRRH